MDNCQQTTTQKERRRLWRPDRALSLHVHSTLSSHKTEGDTYVYAHCIASDNVIAVRWHEYFAGMVKVHCCK